MWFSDAATFGLHSPLNSQNERFYRAVEVKTEIAEEDLLVECDRQQPSIMVYGGFSFCGRTELRFIEGNASGQHDIPVSRRRKNTVTKEVYTEEMLPAMFDDINAIMDGHLWCWQQDLVQNLTLRNNLLSGCKETHLISLLQLNGLLKVRISTFSTTAFGAFCWMVHRGVARKSDQLRISRTC